MDVPLRRTVNGCLWWPAVIVSFGLVPLITRAAERGYVRHMDESGFQTRGGKHFGWTEVTGIRREQTMLNGRLANDSLRLTTARGAALLPLFRTDNPAAVLGYALQHLPESVTRA